MYTNENSIPSTIVDTAPTTMAVDPVPTETKKDPAPSITADAAQPEAPKEIESKVEEVHKQLERQLTMVDQAADIPIELPEDDSSTQTQTMEASAPGSEVALQTQLTTQQ